MAPLARALGGPHAAALLALFGAEERARCLARRRPEEGLAARLAAKAAVAQLLRARWAALHPSAPRPGWLAPARLCPGLQVLPGPLGRPELRCSSLLGAPLDALGQRGSWVSLSHDRRRGGALVALAWEL